MKHIILIIVLTLGGCAIKPVPLEPQIITQTEYVIKIPPAELMTLPTPVPNIDVDTAKQSDVAGWLIKKEAYTQTLENDLMGIVSFFSSQQAQLNQAAKVQTSQLQTTSSSAQAAEVTAASKKSVDLSAAK